MIVTFFDRQDSMNPLNGRKIDDRVALLALLDSLKGRPPFFIELVGTQGYKLLLGLAETVGCAQYNASDGSPPYLMAVVPRKESLSGHIEFLIGGTPTPVSSRYCLQLGVIREVAAHFLETGVRSPDVSWEEI